MKKTSVIFAKLITLLFVSTLFACSTPSATPSGASATNGTISIVGAYATINAGPNSSAYMMISNNGDTPERLISVSATDANPTTLHETQNNNGVMSMVAARDGFEIPARGKIELAPSGKHVMLENVKRNLKIGDTTAIVLKFQSGKEIALTLPVREPGSAGHGH